MSCGHDNQTGTTLGISTVLFSDNTVSDLAQHLVVFSSWFAIPLERCAMKTLACFRAVPKCQELKQFDMVKRTVVVQ
jgi:hypothetical protein